MKRRLLIAALVLMPFIAVAVTTRETTTVIQPKSQKFTVELVASVNIVNFDVDWRQDGGQTSGGAVRFLLDDLRTVTILPGTLVDDYDSVTACTNFTTPNACVLLADMLGDAVVWFALVQSDTVLTREFLTLPGLVDMQSNGNEGILRNGWIVKLATPVQRQCENTDTSSLRDFINRFPDTASQSMMNLTKDEVMSVRCVER